jgi:two-component system NarL family sensor kinase
MSSNDAVLIIVFITLIIFLLVSVVIFVALLSQRRSLQQQTKMANMQLEYQKELRTIETETQEQTLSYISGELHDNISQQITVLSLQVEKQKLVYPDMEEPLMPVTQTIRTIAEQVRLLSHALSNDFIVRHGFVASITQEVLRLQQLDKLQLHWQHDGSQPALSPDQELVLFRIFQEVMNNALKHASAANIYITLKGSAGAVFELKDDGRGFDLQRMLQHGKGHGLKNIIKRAELASLRCHIDAAEGKGCTYVITNRL